MTGPLLTFIIGTENRPKHLQGLLSSLIVQTCDRWQAIVVDEGTPFFELKPGLGDLESAAISIGVSKLGPCWATVHLAADQRIVWCPSGPAIGDWHQTRKCEAAGLVKTPWLCFPQDDAYYVPTFVETMVKTGEDHNLGLVYCNWLYDKFQYEPWGVKPKTGHIDIGGFIVRRSVLQQVPWTSREQTGDGQWVEAMVKAKVKHGRAPGVLYVKN